MIYIHTPKGVRRGEPADRVFVVVTIQVNGDLLAWKCTLTRTGYLSHPAFKRPLPLTHDGLRRAALLRGRNGSEPTALFRPDSLYREVTLADLRSLT